MQAAALKKGIRVLGFYTGGPGRVRAEVAPRHGRPEGAQGPHAGGAHRRRDLARAGSDSDAHPVPEVYSALRSGVVDAGEGNIVTYRTSKLDEVAPHVLHIRYLITVVLVAIAESRWQTLPADLRASLGQAFRESLTFERRINEEEESRNLAELRAKGRTVVVPEDLGPYQKAVQAVYEQYGKGIGPEKSPADPGAPVTAAVRRLVERVSAGLMAAITGVVAFQVLTRYVFQHPAAWPEERPATCSCGWRSSARALGVDRGVHFSLDLLTSRFPSRVAHRLAVGIDLACAALRGAPRLARRVAGVAGP